MLDLKIQYHPERFLYTNIDYWWILPKRNEIKHLFAGNRLGRITNEGLLSVETYEGNKNIELAVPDDFSIFACLLTGNDYYKYQYTDNIRKPMCKNPFGHISLSDKGRYVRGFIELFSSLYHVGKFVSNHYWRTLVERLCKRNIEEVYQKLKPIKNKLNKVLPQLLKDFAIEPKSATEYLAKYILNQARSQNVITAETKFDYLFKEFCLERKKFASNEERNKGFDRGEDKNRQDLLNSLSELTEMSVFFQGIKPRCKNCGSSFWYSAEEIKSTIVCRGCKSLIDLPVESEWNYRLNDLVTNAVSYHGVLPVIWTLGHLLSYDFSCCESFIYVPSVSLYENYASKKPLAEIDFVCIIDGKFVIGEVKTNVDEFSSIEINKIINVSKNILPNEVIIAAFYGENVKLDKIAKNLSMHLDPLGISVKSITPPPYVFEPEYHICI
ncbi:MAG: hypothetical protein HYU63_03815 [Armatimonadetes bacterium]|nr:hypothetical protein [Armatimonadota bacterium]